MVSTARACFVEHEGQYLFAWHHSANCDRRRHAAVVLCPPLDWEYVCAYRSWRILAERLAATGFDTFRFDYRGTGDSTGDRDGVDQPEAWVSSIARMIDVARRASGSTAVALVGLRGGALLALEAAARAKVDRLVLWSGFASGRAWLRELRALERFSRQDHVPEVVEEPDIHAAGFTVTAAAAATLADLSVDALTACPAPEILVAGDDDRADDTSVACRVEELGSQVTRLRLPGTTDLLAQPVLSKVPELAINAIVEWMEGWLCSSSGAACAPAASQWTVGRGCARGERFLEWPVRFGPSGRLFGLLTMPLDGRGITRSVILLTTGTEHRIGPNGLYVALAREWAASGHIVLRYDLGGIGDSAPPPGEPENVVYPAHALADLQAAIDVASGRAPDQAIVVVGLCSGGYLAFLAAREGLSIDAIVAINPPLFLREGPRGVARLVEDDEIVRYRRSLVDPAKWAKALRGRASYLHAVQAGAAAVGRSVRGALHSLREQPLEGLARDLEIVRGRGCRCRFVFSQGDGGLQYFDLCAPTPPRIEGVPEPIERIVVEGAGHTFRPPAAQRVLRQLLVEVVEQGSGGSSRSSPSRDQAAASR